MNRLTIRCDNCRQCWSVANTFSLYEQLAVESRPCPKCGAYTLCYPDPAGSRRRAARRRRPDQPVRASA